MISLRERIAEYDRKMQAVASSSASATPLPATSATSSATATPAPASDASDVSTGSSPSPSSPASPASPASDSAPPSSSPNADSYASSTDSDEPASDRVSAPASDDDARPLTPPTAPCRKNEHLAITIPRNLWKPDRAVKRCDKYACPVTFSLFERRHHCRKCGGIYCHGCSSRTTPLLDTSRLSFLFPPKNTPITTFAAPNAPIVDVRVCDECYNQLHGLPTPRTRPSSSSPPSPRISTRNLPLADSTSSLSSLSPATPPDGRHLIPRAQSAAEVTYNPRITSHGTPVCPTPPFAATRIPRVRTTKLDGELDRYPLKDPSATCKAAGSCRWQPKRYPPRWDGRLPDGRIRFEAEVEKLREEAALRRANPVIIDGEIRVRKLRAPPPPERGGPYKLPTF